MKPDAALGVLTTDMEEVDMDASELFSELGLLVVESRTPEPSSKGRRPGPHCPAKAGRTPQHKCARSNFECQRYEVLVKQMALLWRNRIPMCIEVLLVPKCEHGAARARQTDVSAAPTTRGENSVLLEQWTVQALPRRSCESVGVGPSAIFQAVKSYLYFSQLSAWLNQTNGKDPENIIYRISPPGEFCTSVFSEPAEWHTFPVSTLGKNSIKVTVGSLPRRNKILHVPCFLNHAKQQTRNNLEPSALSPRNEHRSPQNFPEQSQNLSVKDGILSIDTGQTLARDPHYRRNCLGGQNQTSTNYSLFGNRPVSLNSDFPVGQNVICQQPKSSQISPVGAVGGIDWKDSGKGNRPPPPCELSMRPYISGRHYFDPLSPQGDTFESCVLTRSSGAIPKHYDGGAIPKRMQVKSPPHMRGVEHCKTAPDLDGLFNAQAIPDAHHCRPPQFDVFRAEPNQTLCSKVLTKKSPVQTYYDKQPAAWVAAALMGSTKDSTDSDTGSSPEIDRFLQKTLGSAQPRLEPMSPQEMESYLTSLYMPKARRRLHSESNSPSTPPTTPNPTPVNLGFKTELPRPDMYSCMSTKPIVKSSKNKTSSKSPHSPKKPLSGSKQEYANRTSDISHRSKGLHVTGQNETIPTSSLISPPSLDIKLPTIEPPADLDRILNLKGETLPKVEDIVSSSISKEACVEIDVENEEHVQFILGDGDEDEEDEIDECKANSVQSDLCHSPKSTSQNGTSLQEASKATQNGASSGILCQNGASPNQVGVKPADQKSQSGRNNVSEIQSQGKESGKDCNSANQSTFAKKENKVNSVMKKSGASPQKLQCLHLNSDPVITHTRSILKQSLSPCKVPPGEHDDGIVITTPTKPPTANIGEQQDTSNSMRSHPAAGIPRGKSASSLLKNVMRKELVQQISTEDSRVVSKNRDIPSEQDKQRFCEALHNSASMIFHAKTGLPLQSSPAPIKKRSSMTFDYDRSLDTPRAIKNSLSCLSLDEKTDGEKLSEEERKKFYSASAPASTNSLLGNFEESILNGRIEPTGVVDGFSAEIGASGSFCPKHVTLPVTAFFFNLSDDNAPSPYLGHINLDSMGKRGYHVPKSGTVQVTLFNPNKTVVKMFVVMYNLSDMPGSSQTFLRQRTLYMPVSGSRADEPDAPIFLRYLIHLRFASSKSGKIYLHTDLRLIFARDKFEYDSRVANYELRSFTEGPVNPKFSPKR